MATFVGTNGADFKDFLSYGYSNDKAWGQGGNDTLYGWHGHDMLAGGDGSDKLYGESGMDSLYGGNGYDKLYGGSGNDLLSGNNGADDLYGGKGVDKMWGGTDGSADYFYFYAGDTGDKTQGKADTIYDFNNVDQIYIKGSYGYAGSDSTPSDGKYSIWKSGSDWVVTYNPVGGGSDYNDIIVKGGNPQGDVSFF